ncbi:MAG: DUF1501 domain-containing protein [Planctomycetota bacterium]|nr:DUF1501 domain-containing protein [Planctomycetota bacterium]
MRQVHGFSRREFLRQGGVGLFGLAVTAPAFLNALAREACAAPDADERILVVIQLAGGNDGLNTIVPIRDDAYYKLRPNLSLKEKDLLKGGDDFAFHASCAGLKALYDNAQLSIVQNVGYPNPNRSHFTATDIWETASPDGVQHRGWLGRFFDAQCKGAERVTPESAIALTQEAPLTLQGMKYIPVAFSTPEELDWKQGRYPHLKKAFEKISVAPEVNIGVARTRPTLQGELDYLERVSLDAQICAEKIKDACHAKGRVAFPEHRLGRSFEYVAKLIHARMKTRIFYIHQGGYDTHTQQPDRHAKLLQELSDSLKAFIDDLAEQRNLERVLVMTFTEFGRRVGENGSRGTDHGAAGPMFLLGGPIIAGRHGGNPDLVNLNRGDLVHKIDFRQVYADVITNWLKADATQILGQAFSPPGVIRL